MPAQVSAMSNADKYYTNVVEYPHAQLRFSLDTNGVPTRFFIQLGYRVEDDWEPIVHLRGLSRNCSLPYEYINYP